MSEDQDFSSEDVAEMRRQGDLRAFLRGQIRQTKPRGPQEQQHEDERPGHIPGAWPMPPADLPDYAPRSGRVCVCPACASYTKKRTERNNPS